MKDPSLKQGVVPEHKYIRSTMLYDICKKNKRRKHHGQISGSTYYIISGLSGNVDHIPTNNFGITLKQVVLVNQRIGFFTT